MQSNKKQQDLRRILQDFYNRPVARVSLELFLSIGAVLFFAVFAIRPTLLTMSDLLKEIEDKRELDQQLDRKVAALSTVQGEYLEMQDRLGVLDLALPNQPQLLYTLKTIEKLASEQQLVIESLSVAEIPEEKPPEPIGGADLVPIQNLSRVDLPMLISVSGDYPNIRQFIESLRSYRRQLVIDTVIFTTEESRNARKLRAAITISAPYIGTNPDITDRSTRSTQ